MILIDEILVSDDLLNSKFVCDLNRCKGACCIEGDFGAPLEDNELNQMEKVLEIVNSEISEEAKNVIEKQGVSSFYPKMNAIGTSLTSDGACVFVGRNKLGIAYCTIEKAQKDGLTNISKPISCHLYPVRASHHSVTGLTALNYDQWNICSPACENGKRLNVPLYQFVKDALIRKFGAKFYNTLDEIASQLRTDPIK